MKLIVATGNEGKVKEINEILAQVINNAQVLSLKDVYNPVPDIPETGDSFSENSLQKAEWVRSRENCWVLADDSGLEVDALDGAPGIYSARFAGEPSDSIKNMDKLLDELKDVNLGMRGARFRCVMVLLSPTGEKIEVSGSCEGTINFEKSGVAGFGYDPIFTPVGHSKTFAELGKNIKNEISHRAKALKQLKSKIGTIA
jgi:XTP/dITP diphosphohydrolase